MAYDKNSYPARVIGRGGDVTYLSSSYEIKYKDKTPALGDTDVFSLAGVLSGKSWNYSADSSEVSSVAGVAGVASSVPSVPIS